MVSPAKTVDEYISMYPKDVQTILEKLRRTIRVAAPKSEEVISYQIPTYRLNGKNLVHFGGFSDHISFFPTLSPMDEFKKELSQYKSGKATVRFALDKPIPYGLVRRIVKFRTKEIQDRKQKTAVRLRRSKRRKL